ncbi:MAG: zinc-ribbon domain-containing protein [Eubacteriales bacterium]|nr:zinc-ribbon domain-containing protein [Eubacteriales bacterium]
MKYCTKCGSGNEDQAMFCANCGQAFEQPAAEQPVVEQPVVEQPVEAPAYTEAQPAAVVNDPNAKNPATLWMILNIVLTVLCCCSNVAAIVGIVFGAIGMSSFNKGNLEDAEAKTKIAKIMFFVGLGLGVLSFIISLATGLMSSLPEIINNLI